MGTTVKKLYNILDNSKTENLSPETLQYVEELKLKVEEPHWIELQRETDREDFD